MRLDDISQVVRLDALSFATPWPERTYRYELLENRSAILIVLETPDVLEPTAEAGGADGGLSGWVNRLLGRQPEATPASARRLAGYSGSWQIVDEAHISTIAVHPDWRGRKLGELLIWMMIRQALRHGAAYVTLEVRVSNAIAQNLYRKYGFEIVGRRKGYYRDNHEDAYNMCVGPMDDDYRSRLEAYRAALAEWIEIIDNIPEPWGTVLPHAGPGGSTH
ncbi:MAG: ribosomal protein S18-alanine N-acetyltransferase [Anaerolineae bacterium]|nr:ribosomal protein S18-alanine N-acetyltransferase [Anaerolineae bacterium]